MSNILEQLERIQYLNRMGIAGIDKDGKIVDRREYPESIAVKENKSMGIPHPSELHKCLDCGNIERFEDLSWNNDMSMSNCPKCHSENLEELPTI